MTTGERIKAARKAAGMTQAELAAKLGISYVGVSQWENDLRNPKYETLQRIASALNTVPFMLLGSESHDIFSAGVIAGQDALDLDNSYRGYSYSQSEYSLIDAFSKLNEDGQQKAIERVEELTEIPKYQKKDAPEEE